MEKLIYNNNTFTKMSSGYYLGRVDGKSKGLHVAIWEHENNTSVPNGHEIHHVDFNRDNNNPENLECLTKSDHCKIHANKSSFWKNSIVKARSKASDWHKSEEGRKWHKENSKKNWDKIRSNPKNIICKCCGKEFEALLSNRVFCSHRCQQKKNAKIEKNCKVCDSIFSTNKYRPARTCSRSCANKIRFMDD